ncbi:hypothetical protein TIFTF001_003202 [Ficus carica]|uniref:Uncharacterized protein n=1 Tax=Ficus carica TaxID=3494 RepID=A0AA88CTR1_FICCA|nr:hypothetical protein TIFTF001_003202 [Ficus carica]
MKSRYRANNHDKSCEKAIGRSAVAPALLLQRAYPNLPSTYLRQESASS